MIRRRLDSYKCPGQQSLLGTQADFMGGYLLAWEDDERVPYQVSGRGSREFVGRL